MSFSHKAGNHIRLRISEIGLQPDISERAIKTKLFVDGVFIKELPTIERGQTLKWTNFNIIDATQTSRLELAVYERQYRKYIRYESEPCLASEMMGISTKMLKIQGTQYSAELSILNQAQADESFAESHAKLTEIGQTHNANAKLKNTQRMFKSMLEFGSAVAELHPIAKMVFAVCTRAWERLEEQQNSGEELEDLAARLVEMFPLVDEVKKYARLEPLRQTIEEFLRMIEDVSIFVLERKHKGFVAQVFRSAFDSSDRDRVEELVKRFQKTKGDFDTAIGVQTMAMVATADERELLKQLNPVEPSGHDPTRACQDGTRFEVLGYVDDWIADQNPSSTFMWIYGQAGIGKSTVLSSRDDPALREPLRLINSVAHGLACRYPPYGKHLAKVIQANSELCTSHLRVRYEGLLKKPLSELRDVSLPPCFVLIDAMDECGVDESRRQLLGHIWELSSLVPWLRFIVTSRPSSDIRSFFDHSDTMAVLKCDINTYPAADDIRAFIEVTIGDIAIRDEWPTDGIGQLCAKSGELFIWATTACKFIIKSDDTQDRLRQLLDGNTPGTGFDGLDSLYMAVIRNSMADQATDSILNMRRCIGVIAIISMTQPVPIEVLCKIMQPHMKPGVLRNVVGRLGAVLYSDAQLVGAIRVLHPSFADFALDKNRSGDFWVDPVQRNMELSVGCMSTMEQELKFNICELETSHLLNSEVPDLELRIEANISGQLAYSCIYWINHLVERHDEAAAANILDSPRLLYWLEILSLLQRVDVALKGLRQLSQWLMPYQRNIAHYAWDAHRFVFAFSDPIIASAPHIYISALPLAPRQSEVSRRLLPHFPNTAAMGEGGDEAWPGWLRSITLPYQLRSLHVSRDSQRLVVSGCNHWNEPATTLMFDMRTGGLLRVFEHPSESTCRKPEFVTISPDGNLVASGSAFGEILFWDANAGTLIYRAPRERFGDNHDFSIRTWAFSPDGGALRLLEGRPSALNGKTTIWETTIWETTIWEIDPRNSSKVPLLQVNNNSMTAAAFSPDGAQVAIGSHDGRLVIYSWSNRAYIMQFDLKAKHSPDVIVFSANGTLIATALNARGTSGVQLWDTKTGASIGAFMEHTTQVSSIAFSSDGTQLITSADTMQIWDTKTCAVVGSPFGVHVGKANPGRILLFFSPDDTYVLSGSLLDTKIRMWDISSSNTPIENYTDTAFTPKRSSVYDTIESVAFSQDGTCIISGSNDCIVQTWDAQTGIPIDEPLSMKFLVRQVSLFIDCTWIMIAIINLTNQVFVWNARIAGQRSIQHKICTLALSPDGNHLVTGSNSGREMTIWDMGTSNKIKEIDLAPEQLYSEFITFSLDGSPTIAVYLRASRGISMNQQYVSGIPKPINWWESGGSKGGIIIFNTYLITYPASMPFPLIQRA